MTSALVALHYGLAVGLIALLALIVVASLPRVIAAGPPPRLYTEAQRLVTGLILVELLVGLTLLALGRRPQTLLHLMYALAAVAVMPVARTLLHRNPSRARLYQFAGTVLLLGVIFRLATTG